MEAGKLRVGSIVEVPKGVVDDVMNPGQQFEVVGIDNLFNSFYIEVKVKGRNGKEKIVEGYCNLKGCAHLNGKDWTIVKY